MKEAESIGPKITEAELLKLIGDPVEFRRNNEQFGRSCDASDAQYQKLLEKYPDQWVAFYDGTFRGAEPTLAGIVAKLKVLGLPRTDTYVRFVAKSPKPIIL